MHRHGEVEMHRHKGAEIHRYGEAQKTVEEMKGQ